LSTSWAIWQICSYNGVTQAEQQTLSSRHPRQRSPAIANATRDWRIYCDIARLIGIARRLYAEEPLGVELKDTVYALDSTTIDLFERMPINRLLLQQPHTLDERAPSNQLSLFE